MVQSEFKVIEVIFPTKISSPGFEVSMAVIVDYSALVGAREGSDAPIAASVLVDSSRSRPFRGGSTMALLPLLLLLLVDSEIELGPGFFGSAFFNFTGAAAAASLVVASVD